AAAGRHYLPPRRQEFRQDGGLFVAESGFALLLKKRPNTRAELALQVGIRVLPGPAEALGCKAGDGGLARTAVTNENHALNRLVFHLPLRAGAAATRPGGRSCAVPRGSLPGRCSATTAPLP